MTDVLEPIPKAHRLAIPDFPHHLTVAVHPANDEHISAEIAARGIWEPDETAFILKAVRPGDTFVDVGANIGYFTLIVSRLAGDAQVAIGLNRATRKSINTRTRDESVRLGK